MYADNANRFVYNYSNGYFTTINAGVTVSNLNLGNGSGNFEKVAGTYKVDNLQP